MTPIRGQVAMAAAAAFVLAGCTVEGSGAGSGDRECTSHYEDVTTAPTWRALRAELLRYDEQVVSVRTQARGVDVGAGDQEAVRVVDLLDRKGRRLVQLDVWRTDDGSWSAGAWSQCID